MKGAARIRVITSDGPEQMIALGNQALRTSAREFHQEVAQALGGMAAFLEKINRVLPGQAIERAYKEAWRKKQEKK